VQRLHRLNAGLRRRRPSARAETLPIVRAYAGELRDRREDVAPCFRAVAGPRFENDGRRAGCARAVALEVERDAARVDEPVGCGRLQRPSPRSR
jgi:hypothetical protein